MGVRKGVVFAVFSVVVRECACFPGDATVTLESGESRTMADLRIGDKVMADGGTFEPVWFFGNADATAKTEVIRFHSQKNDKSMRISLDHFMPVGKGRNNRYADKVEIGDRVASWDGLEVAMDIVDDKLYEEGVGLFDPYTTSGTIVVDGMLASCHVAPRSWTFLDHIWPTELEQNYPDLYQFLSLVPRFVYGVVGPGPWAAAFRAPEL